MSFTVKPLRVESIHSASSASGQAEVADRPEAFATGPALTWEPEAATASSNSPRGTSAPTLNAPTVNTPGTTGIQRFHAFADTVLFVGLLNLLVLVFTLAGGIVLGWAPAHAAAVRCSRSRLRGDLFPVIRTFAQTWREQFVAANALQAPGVVVLLVLVSNAIGLRVTGGPAALVVLSCIAAGVVVCYQIIAVTMDAHYELERRQVLRLAPSFLVRFPGVPLLLAATLALITVATLFVPGLLPILSIGTAMYLCTALCLSFFAANDRNISA